MCAIGCHCCGADPGGKYYVTDGHLGVERNGGEETRRRKRKHGRNQKWAFVIDVKLM